MLTASRWSTGVSGLVATALVMLAGCSGDSGDATTILTDEQLTAAERRFEPIRREERLFTELLEGDADRDAIEAFVESAYAPGIVFDDVSFGAYDVGRERVADMYGTFLLYFADAEISWRPPLVGDETAVSVITFQGVSLGGVEFTADEPLVEVDLITAEDDQITEVTLFYERSALERISPRSALPADAEGYVEAWNSGRPDRIVELYSVDAIRLDGLDAGTAPRAIADSVERFSAALGEATWTLDLAFAQDGGNRAGAVMTVVSGDCSAEVAAVWTLDDDGSITHEILHYEPSSVADCSWIE